MRLSDTLLSLFRFLLVPAILTTILLYAYAPLLDCSFPLARNPEAGCSIPGQQKEAVPAERAPFRLLAFGDPQLEGDTSIPNLEGGWLPSLWDAAQKVRDDGLKRWAEGVAEDVLRVLKRARKKVDLWGNDLYLAHIYRSVHRWSDPTHVVVLGDLLGSQWISDDEFNRRSDRFWNKVFKGGSQVPKSITQSSGRKEVLGEDKTWKNRIIAVAGNHDIGYAGDIDSNRISRFEEAFGSVNWDITFSLPKTNATQPASNNPLGVANTPNLHMVILNSMNLDSPAKDESHQQLSRDHALTSLSNAASSPNAGTVLLTHIPFHKPAGVCVDETLYTWFPEGGIKEQNHLSRETSAFLLNTLTSNGEASNAVVLNGHDHEGCDTSHYLPSWEGPVQPDWHAVRTEYTGSASTLPGGVREVTVRSMMGSYSGNAGFLSAWWDAEQADWKFEYSSCFLGVQHIWWGVHVFDLVVVGIGIAGVVLTLLEVMAEEREEAKRKKVKTS